MWSQVLDPGARNKAQPQANDTFVQLEESKLTKAFTPQGLLSAGMQDKQDRSAKRQEELARESGASLINVPNKPPPPQTGLLGAITAHERERQREGGVGAALTEREREKRVAEDRQRRFDEQQRQQLDQMQQGGSMYGGQQFPGFNPMMNPMMGMNPMMMGMNPMMTGMNPMMTGQGMSPMMTGQGMPAGGMNPMMGYPGMMPGYNPQHMFAAQQAAAQAYQQAMMAFSTAGSQVGGEGGNAGGTPSQMNPMMTGGNMSMFDPRMSMMGMPMMSPPMGMPMQMTGMSGFDPRFGTPNNGTPMDSPLAPPSALGQGQGQFSSRTSSPARGRGSASPHRGSPLIRPVDHNDTGGRASSRPTSPKP
jgi:CCR4-NOT transcriptional complex subunit CAF120